MNDQISDRDRYPTLSEAGERILKFMREHPHAPIYRNQSGNRLTQEDILKVNQFEQTVTSKIVNWGQNTRPDWLLPLVSWVYDEVPYYKSLGAPPRIFEDIPCVSRANYAADIAQFVPNSVELDRLINFQTTGTTGNPLLIASHPVVAACYLPLHKKALRRFGVELSHGRGQVGVVLIGYQRKCFTYMSVTPTMDESGLAKINLHPDDWRNPDHRAQYLDALNAEIITGDPLSFSELLALRTNCRPKALISVGMMLTQGLKTALESRFNAPVIDIYSLNEAGPVAVFDSELKGHVLLQPNLYVELVNKNLEPVNPGERGEITLTGGFNFCLPLLRYRTGDYASMTFTSEGPVLIDLSGRVPVRYNTEQGEWVNNIDITHALRPYPLAQFAFHQAEDASLTLRLAASSMHMAGTCLHALIPIFGAQKIKVEQITEENKVLQYTTAMKGGTIL